MQQHLPSKSLPRKTLYFLFGACLLLAFTPLGIMQSGLDNPTKVDNYFNGAFPSLPPGTVIGGGDDGGGSGDVGGSLRLVDGFPRLSFKDPIDMQQIPGTNIITVASRQGVIRKFNNDSNTGSTSEFGNVSSDVAIPNDAGFLAHCYDPRFTSGRRYVYMYYTANGSGGRIYLRLSRYTVNNNNTINRSSELRMINVRMYGRTHRGGTCIIGDDNHLYLSIGDQERYETSQSIANNFEGGIFRLDILQNANKSHAPKRIMGRDAGNSDEYTGRGYLIPNDNPFVRGGNDKSVFEEYYAVGVRQPYRMRKDQLTGDIYFSEVGSKYEEEVNFLVKGANYQWPYKEGSNSPGRRKRPSGNAYVGNEREPMMSFSRNETSAIIGGTIYRGHSKDLYGHYIAVGYEQDKIFKIKPNGGKTGGTKTQFDRFRPRLAINIGTLPNGEMYVMGLGNNSKLWRFQQGNGDGGDNNGGGGTVVEAPQRLSQTGVFKNMNTLELADGFIPYEPIEKLFSDYAVKLRAVAIPNTGTRFRSSQKIKFSEEGDWEFPVGTVLMKHFEMPTDENNPNKIQRLETRFMVKDENGEFYGITYKWDGDDAFLLEDGESETLRIKTKDGGTRNQVWDYPSRSDCFRCHTSQSNFVLGLKTRHLNKDIVYPSTGKVGNQIETFNAIGAFDTNLDPNEIKNFLTQAAMDDESESLQKRARSYLDVNCAGCHRPGTSVRASFDLRLSTPFEDQRLVNEDAFDDLGINGARIIVEGDISKSILYQRLNNVDPCCKMPPLGRNVIHTEAVDLIGAWITSLGEPVEPPVVDGEIYKAIEDSYVASNNKSTNFGEEDRLRLRTRANNNFTAYVKFNLGKTANVKRASLRVYQKSGSADLDLDVFGTSNAWTELGLNFNNAPAKTTGQAGTGSTTGGFAVIDVTDYAKSTLAGQTVISFCVESGNNNNELGYYGTKESGQPIELILELEEDDPTIPVASFTASPLSGIAPMQVQFDASSSSDSDGSIISYAWDFGDGNNGAGPNPTHTFTAIGTFTVRLTVTDNDGKQASTTVGIETTAPPPNQAPIADLQADPITGSGPLKVSFTGSGSSDPDGNIVKYTWDFGDGNGSDQASVDHTYTSFGTFTASLTVEDDGGLTNTLTETITVIDPNKQVFTYGVIADAYVKASSPNSNYGGRGDLRMKANGNYSQYSYAKFEALKGLNVTQATLKVFSNGSSGNIIMNVYGTDANWSETNINAANAPAKIPGAVGTANISNNVDFFEIDVTAIVAKALLEGSAVSFCLESGNGDKTLGVLTSKEGGAPMELTINSSLPNTPPEAVASANPEQGPAPLIVSFDASTSTDDGTIESYAWEYGDGNTGTGATPSHTYKDPGYYTATVIVTDDAGSMDTASVEITVGTSDGAPVAVIDAAPLEGKAPLLVNFDGTNSYDIGGTIVSYKFEFGDDSSSFFPGSAHPYNDPGVYEAKLIVTDNDGLTGEATVSVNVLPPNVAPVADIQASATEGNAPTSINFDGSGSTDSDGTIIGYVWDFGDGTFSTDPAPSHTYETGGIYTVSLTVEDDNLAKGSTSIQVDINAAPVANIVADPVAGELPLAVLFDGSGSTDSDGTIVSYAWDFGDGNTSDETSPAHEFITPGTFTTTLTVTDEDGSVGAAKQSIEVVDPNGQPVALVATEASYTNSGNVEKNFGTRSYIKIREGKAIYKGFVKFDLNAVQGSVNSAVLKLHNINDRAFQILIGGTKDNWTETTINYNNMPFQEGADLGILPLGDQKGYYEIDVTDYVKGQASGDKLVSFIIGGPLGGGIPELDSDEGSNPPILEINGPVNTNRLGRTNAISFESLSLIKVYPNPFEKAFQVELNALEDSETIVDLVTLSGKRVQRWKFRNQAHIVLTPDASLPAGVYMIIAKNGRHSERIKLVKR